MLPGLPSSRGVGGPFWIGPRSQSSWHKKRVPPRIMQPEPSQIPFRLPRAIVYWRGGKRCLCSWALVAVATLGKSACCLFLVDFVRLRALATLSPFSIVLPAFSSLTGYSRVWPLGYILFCTHFSLVGVVWVVASVTRARENGFVSAGHAPTLERRISDQPTCRRRVFAGRKGMPPFRRWHYLPTDHVEPSKCSTGRQRGGLISSTRTYEQQDGRFGHCLPALCASGSVSFAQIVPAVNRAMLVTIMAWC
ncbi:unnamed protein product [Protopolystoma xenopodis]|uniref:Uncharacterized protein n=1 Tax=Protopolystoma xenopodis TaxID=117903 RepID=A0A3S5B2S6_9PLAT|nr:unnamed protein product [Protopolystoma xenopodis]